MAQGKIAGDVPVDLRPGGADPDTAAAPPPPTGPAPSGPPGAPATTDGLRTPAAAAAAPPSGDVPPGGPAAASAPPAGGSEKKLTVRDVAFAAIGAVATGFLGQFGKDAVPDVRALLDGWFGTRVVHVTVFTRPGRQAVQGSRVELIPRQQGAATLVATTDERGRASFSAVGFDAFYVAASGPVPSVPFHCTSDAGPTKFPAVIQLEMGEPCTRLAVTPVVTSRPASAGATPWLARAEGEIGVAEISGDDNNPRIVAYLEAAGIGGSLARDETPWGCAFVAWAIREAHLQVPKQPAACSSWLDYGTALDGPRVGAIGFVGREGIAEARTGVAGIVSAVTDDGVTMIVGNVGNAVAAVKFPLARIQAFRYPPTSAGPRQ